MIIRRVEVACRDKLPTLVPARCQVMSMVEQNGRLYPEGERREAGDEV